MIIATARYEMSHTADGKTVSIRHTGSKTASNYPLHCSKDYQSMDISYVMLQGTTVDDKVLNTIGLDRYKDRNIQEGGASSARTHGNLSFFDCTLRDLSLNIDGTVFHGPPVLCPWPPGTTWQASTVISLRAFVRVKPGLSLHDWVYVQVQSILH